MIGPYLLDILVSRPNCILFQVPIWIGISALISEAWKAGELMKAALLWVVEFWIDSLGIKVEEKSTPNHVGPVTADVQRTNDGISHRAYSVAASRGLLSL